MVEEAIQLASTPHLTNAKENTLPVWGSVVHFDKYASPVWGFVRGSCHCSNHNVPNTTGVWGGAAWSVSDYGATGRATNTTGSWH